MLCSQNNHKWLKNTVCCWFCYYSVIWMFLQTLIQLFVWFTNCSFIHYLLLLIDSLNQLWFSCLFVHSVYSFCSFSITAIYKKLCFTQWITLELASQWTIALRSFLPLKPHIHYICDFSLENCSPGLGIFAQEIYSTCIRWVHMCEWEQKSGWGRIPRLECIRLGSVIPLEDS